MKNHLLLLTLFMFATLSFGQATKPKMVKNFWDFNNSVLRSQGYYYADAFNGQTTLEHGLWRYWDRQGRLEEERNYLKGELHGEVVMFYPNGKPKERGFFKMGKQDSVFTRWYDNGNVKETGYYTMDTPTGDWKYYYSNGYHMMEETILDSVSYVQNFWRTDSTQTLKDGNGRTFLYYSSTGHLQEFYTYKDGLKDGDFEEFSAAGNLFVRGQYANNEKEGKWYYWYYTGQIDSMLTYANGRLTGDYIKNYDNGKTNITGTFENGEKVGHWTWFTNVGTNDMEGDFISDKQ